MSESTEESQPKGIAETVNVLQLEPGQRILLRGGTKVEVVENLGDGYWIEVKPYDGSSGDEDLIFAPDIVGLVE